MLFRSVDAMGLVECATTSLSSRARARCSSGAVKFFFFNQGFTFKIKCERTVAGLKELEKLCLDNFETFFISYSPRFRDRCLVQPLMEAENIVRKSYQ